MNNIEKALWSSIWELEILGATSSDAYAKCKSALSDIEKCEPVAEAIRERDRLGFAVVNVIGKLDEIIYTTQEVEIDDFLHIAVPVDMWNELQAALEDMPKRADLYTSPQPRDWVGLSDDIDVEKLALGSGVHKSCGVSQYFRKDFVIKHTSKEQFFYRLKHFAESYLEAKLKQLNTKG